MNHLIPDVGRHRGTPALLPAGGRLIKTHEIYRSAYQKAVYIVRDVRDVVVSLFDYENARQRIWEDFDTFLTLFLKRDVTGYGCWQDHVASWLDASPSGTGQLLMIKFEDLRARTDDTLMKILDFLGVEADRSIIRAAVANNSVQRMREKEDWVSKIDGASRSQTARDDLRFIRSGSIGGWRARLSESQLRLVEQYARLGLGRLGYSLDACPVAVGMSYS